MDSKRVSHRLYQTHRTAFLIYAGRLTGGPQNAEDLVQDAWIRFAQCRTPEITAPVSYFKTIMRNLFQFSRKRSQLEKIDNADFEHVCASVADPAPSPEQIANARQQMNKLLNIIDSMPIRQGAAIKMYHFEGLKLREIAARLELSVSFTQHLIADGVNLCSQIRETER
ncbi:RNA polymerase sigma-70 factor (ECF subfamily) [Zymomonas mobilis]|uniref:RNA polymerase sigma-70 factor (ECF subfamily) n=1 Tax=Zymomonas mobilis TaxID=542 RepID=A0A542VUJ2_ZYMMB|nr:RNA polymerase sigma factor [Zymomonas mobilis]TQL14996.1 RNA polymerase sigma-70 factor (ECF subfamily) [Zymomonas mobilis]